jgi:hypothetical protein
MLLGENTSTYLRAEPQLYTVAMSLPPTVGLCREGAILDGNCSQPHNTPCSNECNMGHRGWWKVRVEEESVTMKRGMGEFVESELGKTWQTRPGT